jgi:5-methylthioadenosine/S-adenosylhomocysteine deaminase
MGDAVMLPGLTNCHTHLELTGLNGGQALVEPHFPAWIRRLRELKARRTRAEFLEAAREGIRQCFRQGVTTIADTGDTGVVPEAMRQLGMRGVVYHEVFGPDPVLVRESVAEVQKAIEGLRSWQSPRVMLGVSPHAPYTVSGPLYREVCRWARERGLPLALHIAESKEESALLATGTGGFADAWRRRSLPMPEPLGLTPVSYLAHWGVFGLDRSQDGGGPADVLAIHAVRVPWDDLELLRQSGTMVAWCPLANRAHGHGDAPMKEFGELGGKLGLGTDSELSVGPIDLLAVARAAIDIGRVEPGQVVQMLLGAARHLPGGTVAGVPQTGLREGLDADVAVFPCPPGADPSLAPLSCTESLSTWAAGREVHRLGS